MEIYADPDDLIPAAQQLPPHKEGEHVIVPVQETGQVSVHESTCSMTMLFMHVWGLPSLLHVVLLVEC